MCWGPILFQIEKGRFFWAAMQYLLEDCALYTFYNSYASTNAILILKMQPVVYEELWFTDLKFAKWVSQQNDGASDTVDDEPPRSFCHHDDDYIIMIMIMIHDHY